MTATLVRPSGTARGQRPWTAVVAGLSVAVAAGAAFLPAWPAGPDMGSTNYMGLLAANQPWNLILFMAIPVVLAETVAVTELAVLFSRGGARRSALVNRWAGLVAGLYFLGVTSYLMVHAVVPLTRDGGWRGPADVIAVGFYLLGLVPLYGMTLLETRAVGADLDDDTRRKVHAWMVGAFLVVAHIAMIFGMLDPTVLGWTADQAPPTHTMPGGTVMHGGTHG
ncbi:DUF6803 family protein [Actinoplanes sp. NPDC049802]|uniref:DUF6803 family protein n=1 Tax=Actinoplanes sp. NPDC049802 TaxID=3154742 RepID=UPI0034043D6A